MFAGQGVYRGSSVLVTGSPGTGKTSLGAAFTAAACQRGERALMFAYEESAAQILRNMRSIGIDLELWVKKGLLEIHAARPTLQGLEQHLVVMHDIVLATRPSVVVIDPISNLTLELSKAEVKAMLIRLIDFLKRRRITALFTGLAEGGAALEESQLSVSSLMDTWLLLRNSERNGERNRTLYIMKSRGMAHSNRAPEFVLTDSGVELMDFHPSNDRALAGATRVTRDGRRSTRIKR
jgi:circadian clock protein KaiC